MSHIHRGDSKLVISIDIGATCSAVAWQHLHSDSEIEPPTNVSGWEGAYSAFDFKVPTSILYEGQNPIKFGKDAEDHEDLPGTVLIRNPKLVLHPEWLQNIASPPRAPLIPGGRPIPTFRKPIIPCHLTIEKIYEDFLNYLIKHTRQSFAVTQLDGGKLFDGLLPTAHWLLGAPNGWSPKEKQFLIDRLAATGLCRNMDNVKVISEAEASLLWLIHTSRRAVALEHNALLTVCDAGGSTIDITLYRCIDPVALKFVEVGSPDCIQKGGFYVSEALQDRLHSLFDKSAQFSDNAILYTRNALADFDGGLKTKWDGTKTSSERLTFSRLYGDTELTSGIRNGKISLPADYLNEAYDTCVPHIVTSLRQKTHDSEGNKARAILLVGGFGDSPYLQRVLREHFEDSEFGPKIPVLVPSAKAPGVKAVSAGGVYMISENRFEQRSGVTARAAVFSYGVSTHVLYDASNLEHRGRRILVLEDGKRYVHGYFARLIDKGESTTSDEFKSSIRFTYEGETREALRTINMSMFMYFGEGQPNFMSEKDGRWTNGFSKVGTVSGRGLSVPINEINKDGKVSFESDFRVGVSFGGLEIKARLETADGTDFGQEIRFMANATGSKSAKQERRDFVIRPVMRRRVKCEA